MKPQSDSQDIYAMRGPNGGFIMYDTDSGSTICASCATNMTEGQIVDSVEIIDGYNEICDCCQCVIVPLYPDNDDEYYNIPIDYKEVT